jgi:hypothetical protein
VYAVDALAAGLGYAEPSKTVALGIASDHGAGYADVRDTRIWESVTARDMLISRVD